MKRVITIALLGCLVFVLPARGFFGGGIRLALRLFGKNDFIVTPYIKNKRLANMKLMDQAYKNAQKQEQEILDEMEELAAAVSGADVGNVEEMTWDTPEIRLPPEELEQILENMESTSKDAEEQLSYRVIRRNIDSQKRLALYREQIEAIKEEAGKPLSWKERAKLQTELKLIQAELLLEHADMNRESQLIQARQTMSYNEMIEDENRRRQRANVMRVLSVP